MKIIWYSYLIVSALATVTVILYVLLNKKAPKILRVVVSVLMVIFLGVVFKYFLFKKEPFFKAVSIDFSKNLSQKTIVPLQAKEDLIKAYINKIGKNRPIIIAIPKDVQIKFTDPINPRSPHAIFQIVFENLGDRPAMDIGIKWNIIDKDDRVITPPDEWHKIVEGTKQKNIASLEPNQGFIYIYGPEIGAYAETSPPEIKIVLTIYYKDEEGNRYEYYCTSKTIAKPLSDRRYLFEITEVN